MLPRQNQLRVHSATRDRKFWRCGASSVFTRKPKLASIIFLTVACSFCSNLKILKLDSNHANAFQGDFARFQGISKPLDPSSYPASFLGIPNAEAQSPARAPARKHPAGTKAGDSQARSWADLEAPPRTKCLRQAEARRHTSTPRPEIK